ncbi:hypothetical protein ACJX0J_012780, partial [Zea mays]
KKTLDGKAYDKLKLSFLQQAISLPIFMIFFWQGGNSKMNKWLYKLLNEDGMDKFVWDGHKNGIFLVQSIIIYFAIKIEINIDMGYKKLLLTEISTLFWYIWLTRNEVALITNQYHQFSGTWRLLQNKETHQQIIDSLRIMDDDQIQDLSVASSIFDILHRNMIPLRYLGIPIHYRKEVEEKFEKKSPHVYDVLFSCSKG